MPHSEWGHDVTNIVISLTFFQIRNLVLTMELGDILIIFLF
jgi:hypothetical protein